MTKKPRIFIDLDGVVAALLPAVDSLMTELGHPVVCANSPNTFEKYGDELVWKCISDEGSKFWSDRIQPLSWATQLVDTCAQHGDIAFLTSPGNMKVNTENSATASHGKHHWVMKHFPEVPLIVTRSKYFLANPNTCLVDDTQRNITEFTAHGGEAFLWTDSSDFGSLVYALQKFNYNQNRNLILGHCNEG